MQQTSQDVAAKRVSTQPEADAVPWPGHGWPDHAPRPLGIEQRAGRRHQQKGQQQATADNKG